MKISVYIAGIILSLILGSSVRAQTFTAKYNSGINSNVTGYYEYLPTGYSLPQNANKKYPVIFYFHGAGELGNVSSNNLEKLKQSAIPRIITAGKFPATFTVNNETFSYIVICPQFISSPINPTQVDAVINYILSQPSVYRIDLGKAYLTGFSLGGKTTWEYMMSSLTNARKIAAAIPIATYCYPIPNMNLMQNVAQGGIAVWALHNPNDLAALSSQCATDYINKLNSYNPVIPGKLTISCVPGGNAPCGHDSSSWNTVYTAANYKLPGTGLNIYEWFYTFRQNAAGVPPNANAGPDVSITMPTNSVVLNGSGSTDPDGTITSYLWRKISGPSSFSINNGSIVNPTISNLVAGTYIIELKVTDNQGFSDLDSVRIIVTNPNANQNPVVNAGNDISITLPTNFTTLTGSGADTDGSIESYLWEKVQGPAQYSISNTAIASPLVSNLITGIYWFRLTVTDNQGGTGTDIVQVQVINPNRNLLPIANAGPDQNLSTPQNNTTLNGSGSRDNDGVIVSYSWSKILGPLNYNITNPNSVTTTVNNLTEGVYWFQLTVTDDSSAVGRDTVIITVSALQRVLIDVGESTLVTNSPDQWGKYWNNMADGRPGLRVNNAVTVVNVTTTIKLEVINRIDGTVATYNPGSSSSGSVGDIGEYPASATNDNIFAHESATNGKWRLYDLDPSRTYTIKFWGSRVASGSRIIQIKRSDETTWQEFNTASNTNFNTAATFSFSGKSEMSFDIQVKSGSVFSYINVIDIMMTSGTMNQSPVSRAGNDRAIILPKDSVKLNGSLSFDPEGSVLQYKWRKISGPVQSNFSNDAIANPDFTNLTSGNYDVELKVTDNAGLSGLDTVRVTVTNSVNIPPVARAGTDQIISHPVDSTVINGSSSSDNDGSITSYKWTKISGPANFIITNDIAANTTIKNLSAGTYMFQLMVTDNQGAQGRDTLVVTVYLMPTPPPTNTDVVNCGRTFKIVVLGSSTALGTGASPIDSSWVNKFRTYVKSKNIQNEVINLATMSLTTYHVLCPNDFIPPANRPAPDTARNITKALSLNPDVIIINLPSNDIGSGFSLIEQKNNYERTMTLANGRNIPVWVTTTQPRTAYSPVERDSLKAMRDWTYARFGTHAIDFWSTVANTDGTINSLYNSGDGVHVNNYGHHIFYSKTAQEKILDELCTQQPPANQLPFSNAGNDASITLPVNNITLNGSSSSDQDGTITSYLWSKISGPSSYSFNNTSLANPTVNNLEQGVYSFRLVVTDNNNAIDDDTVLITVNPAPVITNQRVLIDVGQSTSVTSTPDQWGKYWNNMTDARPGVRVTNAVTSTNSSTTIGLEVVNRIDGTAATYNTGTSASGAVPIVGDYPVSATSDNAYAHESTTTGQWRIFGLDPARTYSIKFWGSRVTSGSRIIQIKRSDESVWQEYNGVNNTDFNTSSTFSVGGKTDIIFDIRVKTGSVMAYINIIDINITNSSSGMRTSQLVINHSKNERKEQDVNLQIFPNPTKKDIHIKFQNLYKGSIRISVFDQFGRIVKRIIATKPDELFYYQMNLSDVQTGVYFVQVGMGNKTESIRVTKF